MIQDTSSDNTVISAEEIREDARQAFTKMTALVIILASPLWPRSEMLCEQGRALHDLLLRDAKPYSLLVAQEKYGEAYRMAAAWGCAANSFMDAAMVNHPDTMKRLANRRLLAVFQHYIDASGVSWELIQTKGRAVA